MKLFEILDGIECEVFGDREIEIESLCHSSKEKLKRSLFFAIEGTKQNGEDFAIEAIKNGAVCVVSNKQLQIDAINVVVDDVRAAMSLCAANFFGHPSKNMKIIAVTGTNGKTTSTFLMASILEKAGQKVGIIGTNGVFISGKKYGQSLTTPDPIDLQKILAFFKRENVGAVCVEVSAHALELQKFRGITTDIALFTNLTQDHLDFFKTMENYKSAKAKLFSQTRFAVFNYDEKVGREFFENCSVPSLTYSRKKINSKYFEANIIASNESHNNFRQCFHVSTPKGEIDISMKLFGGFNISNALGVIGGAILLGIELETIKIGLEDVDRIDGRFNTYFINGVSVVIDYAHTPDGLKNILIAAREITKGRVLSVFGCGGNRDSLKRPVMGAISDEFADLTIITTDNPRFERPEDIAKDIALGISKNLCYVELDREKAIKLALSLANKGDVVVIAGKGAENYMEIQGVKTPFQDVEVINKIIKNLG